MLFDRNTYKAQMSDKSDEELRRLLDQIGRNRAADDVCESREVIESILRDRSSHGVIVPETVFFT